MVLRKDMWEVVKRLKQQGVTIILTTHYIEEAEEIADRVGIINNGKIILVDEKESLIKKIFTICQSGKRSEKASKILLKFKIQSRSIEGGIEKMKKII